MRRRRCFWGWRGGLLRLRLFQTFFLNLFWLALALPVGLGRVCRRWGWGLAMPGCDEAEARRGRVSRRQFVRVRRSWACVKPAMIVVGKLAGKWRAVVSTELFISGIARCGFFRVWGRFSIRGGQGRARDGVYEHMHGIFRTAARWRLWEMHGDHQIVMVASPAVSYYANALSAGLRRDVYEMYDAEVGYSVHKLSVLDSQAARFFPCALDWSRAGF